MKNRNHLLEGATLRVLNQNGKTVSAGFLISESLAVTCAHVVLDAGGKKGGELGVEFYQDRKKSTVKVSDELWSDPTEDDVACLILSEKHGRELIPLARELDTLGHDFAALGFPLSKRPKSFYAEGKLTSEVFISEQTRQLLQLSGKHIYKGMSGSAVLDLATNMIVGMISEYIPVDTEKYGYATTSRVIRSICRISEGREGKMAELVPYSAPLETVHKSLGVFEDAEQVPPDFLTQLRSIVAQFSSTGEEIKRMLQAYPDYYLKFTIEGSIMRIRQKFADLENVFLLSALNQSQEADESLPTVKLALSELRGSILHLIELIR